MSLHFLVALGLAFALEPPLLEDPVQVGLRLAGVALGVVSVAASAEWICCRAVVQLTRTFGERGKILSRYHWLRAGHDVCGLAVYAAVLKWLGWGAIVQDLWGLEDWLLVDELLILAPYLMTETLSLVAGYKVERTIRLGLAALGHEVRTVWTLPQYLNFQLRNQLGIWLSTALVVTAVKDIAAWIVPDWDQSATTALAAMLATSLSVLALSPLIIRFVWQATPLPAGPLRQQLEAVARRLGFRCSNILVWHTSGGVANAAITGIVPQLRYVLLSDALLEQLSAAQVQAVFGHEVGHVRHHHISYYFGFVLGSVLLASLLTQPAAWAIHAIVSEGLWDWLLWLWEYVPLEIWLLGPYFVVVFGILSQCFERQADLFGSRTASLLTTPPVVSEANSDPGDAAEAVNAPKAPTIERGTQRAGRVPVQPQGVEVFIDALEKVAVLNGIGRKWWSWRHGSIASRIAFLNRVAQHPQLADQFDRRVRLLRCGVAVLLAGGVLILLALGQRLI